MHEGKQGSRVSQGESGEEGRREEAGGLAGVSQGSRRGSRRGVSQQEEQGKRGAGVSQGESGEEAEKTELGGSWGEAGGEQKKRDFWGRKREKEERQEGTVGSAGQRSLHTAAPRCLAAFAAVSPLRLLTVWSGLTVRCPGSPTQLEQSWRTRPGARAPDNTERHEVDPVAQMGSTGQRRGAMQPDTGRAGRGTCG